MEEKEEKKKNAEILKESEETDSVRNTDEGKEKGMSK